MYAAFGGDVKWYISMRATHTHTHTGRQIRADVEYLENIFRALELGDEQGGAATEHDGSALSRLHLLQLLVVEFSATSKTTAEGRRLLQTTLDRVAASPIGEAGVVTAGEALANNSTVIVSQIVQLLATNAELRTAYDDVMRLLLG